MTDPCNHQRAAFLTAQLQRHCKHDAVHLRIIADHIAALQQQDAAQRAQLHALRRRQYLLLQVAAYAEALVEHLLSVCHDFDNPVTKAMVGNLHMSLLDALELEGEE